MSMPPPPVQLALAGNSLSRQTYTPRQIQIELTVTGSSVADLDAKLRALDLMLATAAERQTYNQASVVLKTQLENTDADDIEYRVLRGEHRLPQSLTNEPQISNEFKSIKGMLSLLVEPLGRLSQVTLTQVTLENEQDGNNNNFVDVQGAKGVYLSFNGTTDLVTITDASKIQNFFDSGGTIEADIYVKSDGESDLGRIGSKGLPGSDGWDFFVSDESGGFCKLNFRQHFTSTEGVWETTARDITLNKWVHVAVTYDNGSVANNPILYVEAVSKTITETTTPVGTRADDSSNDLIWGNESTAGRTWDGFLDDLRCWSDIRTGTEITDNYLKELVGNELGLIGYWPMNDSAGTVIVDHTSTPLTSAITGAIFTIGGRHLGTEGSRLQIKISDEGTNPWNGIKKMWFSKRSGNRRTDDLWIQGQDETSFVAGTDPSTGNNLDFTSNGNVSDSAASGGAVAQFRWSNNSGSDKTLEANWVNCGYSVYQIAGGSLPEGIFRVLVRGKPILTGANSNWLSTEQGFSLGYSFGADTKTPVDGEEKLFTLAFDVMETLDLGELVIPSQNTPDGYTAPTLDIRIHGIYNSASSRTIEGDTVGTMRWEIDSIKLFPFDEGGVIVDAVATGDRVLIDNLSDGPGVYILNSSDVVQKAATKTGGPWDSGPEPWRFGWHRDDVDDPSTIKANVDIQHTPQTIGL